VKTLLVGNFAELATPECVFSYGAYKDDDRYLAVLGTKFGIFLLLVHEPPCADSLSNHRLFILK